MLRGKSPALTLLAPEQRVSHMPRLFHRPPKYCLHKGTKQAVVSYFGKTLYVGPYGSQKSHERYQEILREWHEKRYSEQAKNQPDSELPDVDATVAKITAASLRQKKRAGSPVTISELILVYRRYTHQYYRKHGKVTREAGMIDDVLRFLRKHHGLTIVDDFGPVALELREKMIDDLDWSRKHINKQVNRLRAMFKWASAKRSSPHLLQRHCGSCPALRRAAPEHAQQHQFYQSLMR